MVKIKRFDICLISLDPTIGSEMKKKRPCLIVSPDSMNLSRINTVIIVPITSKVRDHFPTRISIELKGKKGQIVLDQIRTVDRSRIIKIIDSAKKQVRVEVLQTLQIMFN